MVAYASNPSTREVDIGQFGLCSDNLSSKVKQNKQQKEKGSTLGKLLDTEFMGLEGLKQEVA
jgi:hypothetical protein